MPWPPERGSVSGVCELAQQRNRGTT
jgi:hypothetical protein